MPPRYAYWTILIDQKPTAFRARDKEELLPTFHQLQRKNSDVVMKWFARGKLWDTPEQAQWAQRNMERPREKRGRDWRPGGEHKDPRDRFKKRPRDQRSPKVAGLPPRVSGRRVPGATQGSQTARKFWSGPPRDPRARPREPKKDRG
jgi:hypothetical protein